jgi:hypothetical protein
MLSDQEQRIYNKHLAVSKSAKNQPFRLRKDFTKIEGTDKEKFLKRLVTFFSKHPEVDQNTYFESPYKLYPDVEYFDLEYFASMRAVKAYTMHKQQLMLSSPDTQINEVNDSLRFIARFCVENGIQFYAYHLHKTADLYTWMIHYKENKVNIYAMMEFPDVQANVAQLSEDTRMFFVSNFVERFHILYTQYQSSTKLRPFVRAAHKKLTEWVFDELNAVKNV